MTYTADPTNVNKPLDGDYAQVAARELRALKGYVQGLQVNINPLAKVVSVKDFGAKGDGVTNDSAALQAAVDYAIGLAGFVELTLSGGLYSVDSPISFPAGGELIISGGTIKASGIFPTTEAIIKCVQPTARAHIDLVFENLILDANHRGGCLLLDNYIRVNVNNCRFLHFSTYGLRLDGTAASHECNVRNCFAFEYLYGETGYLTPTTTSVGLQINSPDNIVSGFTSYYTGSGLVVNAQYNQVDKAHVGGSSNALKVTSSASFSSFHQCYFDSQQVTVENPWQTEFIGCKFLHNTTNAAFAFLVLKPLSAGLAINGLKVKGCTFHNIAGTVVTSIKTDTASGSFNPAFVLSCYISENSFTNTTYAYTKYRMSLQQNASTVWTFNVNAYVPFGTVQLALMSFYESTTVKPTVEITSISGNVVTVTASAACNGTVFLDIDVNTATS